MRFREDNPQDLDRARTAVAQWRDQNPAGTEDQLLAALGPQFHPDYTPVLRAVLFIYDRQIPQSPPARQKHPGSPQTAPATAPASGSTAPAPGHPPPAPPPEPPPTPSWPS